MTIFEKFFSMVGIEGLVIFAVVILLVWNWKAAALLCAAVLLVVIYNITDRGANFSSWIAGFVDTFQGVFIAIFSFINSFGILGWLVVTIVFFGILKWRGNG